MLIRSKHGNQIRIKLGNGQAIVVSSRLYSVPDGISEEAAAAINRLINAGTIEVVADQSAIATQDDQQPPKGQQQNPQSTKGGK